MAKKKSKFDWRFLILLPLPLLWALGDHLGYLKAIENKLLDLRFRYRGEIAAPVKLIYVDVDTRAIQLMGEKPWNRARFGDAARFLVEQGKAKGVAFDIVFSAMGHSELVAKEVAAKGNLAFGRVTNKHPEIILGAQYTGGESNATGGQRLFPLLRLGFADREKNSPPELPQEPISGFYKTRVWGTVGLIDVDEEYGGDEIPRWVPLFAESATTNYWTTGLQLACLALGVPPGSARRNNDYVDIVNQEGKVLRHIPVTNQQSVEVNWFTGWGSVKHDPVNVSLADVLLYGAQFTSEKPEEVKEAEDFFEQFKGALILVGPTDVLFHDLGPTPFDAQPVPKVSVHGNLLKTIIAEQYLQRTPKWVMWTAVLLLTISVSALAIVGGNRGTLLKGAAVVLLGAYTFACLALFAKSHLVLPMSAPLGAALSTSFIGIMWQLILEEKQKGRIKGMFGAYVSPELVSRMVDSDAEPQLGGHDDEITAYFSDIQAFSSFSEKLGSGPLVELMNEYLTACTDIVQGEGGTLDKYIGDAVVAMFGAPIPLKDHALRACIASQKVHAKLGELRAKWKGEEGKWPEIVHRMQTRIGLNSGTCMIGNMGSRTRFNYTMMGDNVNLAARMESGAKQFGVYTMIAEATKLECEKHGGDRVVFRYLDQIVVKGRSIPVKIYEVVGLRENLTPTTFECLAVWDKAIALYLAQDFDGAIALSKKSLELEPNVPGRDPGVESNPSLWLASRCEYMKEHPPGEGWDGVFKMKDK
ncbi:MAG: adenylate/guanylate cyclase domain-containing protein [Opitutae bacterium]|nr:adenylate/guanylate cyclase domain-containing protein [Opitutae bacterium]